MIHKVIKTHEIVAEVVITNRNIDEDGTSKDRENAVEYVLALGVALIRESKRMRYERSRATRKYYKTGAA